MGGSVGFDRAAEFYDATRAIPEAAMARTVALLGDELRGRGRVLEVGAGTGLLALPLSRAGIPVTALDLSAAMLRKLVEKASDGAAPPLVNADARRMPFADGAFGAAYLRWVLHLIADWRGALAEAARVLRPGGVLLVKLGAYGGARAAIQERFAELTGVSIEPIGLRWDDVEALDGAIAALGAGRRVLPDVARPGDEVGTLAEFLDGIDEDRYSWTWPLSEGVRRRAAAEARAWAEGRFGPLDRARPEEREIAWRAYDLP